MSKSSKLSLAAALIAIPLACKTHQEVTTSDSSAWGMGTSRVSETRKILMTSCPPDQDTANPCPTLEIETTAKCQLLAGSEEEANKACAQTGVDRKTRGNYAKRLEDSCLESLRAPEFVKFVQVTKKELKNDLGIACEKEFRNRLDIKDKHEFCEKRFAELRFKGKVSFETNIQEVRAGYCKLETNADKSQN